MNSYRFLLVKLRNVSNDSFLSPRRYWLSSGYKPIRVCLPDYWISISYKRIVNEANIVRVKLTSFALFHLEFLPIFFVFFQQIRVYLHISSRFERILIIKVATLSTFHFRILNIIDM